ncbi:MAG: GAF domain-containing sensor histidine kinase [Fibrobacter sp.]|jgi:nitrogen-specific signal transduction histidine kinase|nr:GAF domain-containing sensor histidine kinase [Fibrobacter sp.]
MGSEDNSLQVSNSDNLSDLLWSSHGQSCCGETVKSRKQKLGPEVVTQSQASESAIEFLNESGEIFKSCGKDLLLDIASDYIDLLEICCSIHEKDGSYTISMIRSPWCKYLRHTMSCEKVTGKIGGQGDKFLEKECCCKRFALMSIESGKPLDQECVGGIHIYTMPIKAGTCSIGAISIGYNGPSKNTEILDKIAGKINVDPGHLSSCINFCAARPPFIVDIAIKKLFSSARLIGSMVERRRAETALQQAYKEIEKVVEARTAALTKSYNLLKRQTWERIKAETKSYKMNKALELVYAMATAVPVTLEEVADKIVISISELIHVPIVALGYVEKNEFRKITQIINKELMHFPVMSLEYHPCGLVYKERHLFQITANLNQLYPTYMEKFPAMRSYFGVPVTSSKGKILASICILDQKERSFSDFEKHLIEIFAGYVGYEIERKQMERQLLQSQEMKMLGQLTSGVAHEVRNPLNGILAITEALSKDLGEKSDYSEYIALIRKQVMRLSDLMRDLLNLGRPIEKGKLMPLTVSKTIPTAINLWRQSSIYKNHTVVLKISDDAQSAEVQADRAKIEQVIINLLENACAHSSVDQKIVIEVQAKQKVVIIKVIDQGTGLKPEHFEHMYEPFFTTRKGGTGLGLGIVKRIVESHGGSIEISNNFPPPGACAEVCLPMIKRAAIEEDGELS